jgi:HAD superfamily hydrolase (TIGR01450 family)
MLRKKCVILDLDGTVYLGDIPIAGTVDFIRQRESVFDFYFLSNNTSKSPDRYLAKLRGMGISAVPRQMLSPTAPLVEHLRAVGTTRAYLVGNREYGGALRAAMPELELRREGARAVILAYDTELTYEKLVHSAHLLQNPAVAFYATHPDPVCPDPEGPLPDVGSFLALYEKATGRKPQRIFGKPDPAVLAPVTAKYRKEEMVMVGDRLMTDKKLAENAGIDFILVLSGEATAEDALKEEQKPWKIVRDLGELC